MDFVETGFMGLLIFEPSVFEDARGYFYECYNEKNFNKHGIHVNFVQDNQSKSVFGVIRGLHFQEPPYAQSKLVRVISGNILDVVVDIRKRSPTFGGHFSIELSAANKKQLFVPKGFAHGFSVLSETAEVLYKCDTFYNKESERGIMYDDSDLMIDWKIPTGKAIISEKDKNNPSFASFKTDFVFKD